MAHVPDRFRAPRAVSLALALVASASLASAAQIGIRYDGVDGFGLSQSTAMTAISAGIPVVSTDLLDQADGLTVIRAFDPASVVTGPPATATSHWSVENQRGDARQLYLVFARPLANEIMIDDQPQQVAYAPGDVGLALQSGQGGFDWVIFEVPVGDDLYYYPAVSLGSLGDGQTTASPFAVNYILDNPQIFLEPQGFELGIPKWQLLSAFVPIPEPSTALLVAAGVAALAAGRRSGS